MCVFVCMYSQLQVCVSAYVCMLYGVQGISILTEIIVVEKIWQTAQI